MLKCIIVSPINPVGCHFFWKNVNWRITKIAWTLFSHIGKNNNRYIFSPHYNILGYKSFCFPKGIQCWFKFFSYLLSLMIWYVLFEVLQLFTAAISRWLIRESKSRQCHSETREQWVEINFEWAFLNITHVRLRRLASGAIWVYRVLCYLSRPFGKWDVEFFILFHFHVISLHSYLH